ncbi:hypothetical protein Patl1_37416 [Pistacia atlantica]|nr:hypothetical protein Patl1_37416 [Pistacia atlantica]
MTNCYLQVRTRAVTLQKYICSSEDIFKHASVLVKAELLVSLRLIGLRMSQFNEEKVGAPADPTQKTLANFIMSGDASRKNDLDDNYHRCTYNVGEAEKIHEPSSDETAEKENKSDMIGHSPKYHHNEESQLLEANSSVLQHYEGSQHDRIEAANSLDKEAVSSSNQEDQNFWVDDYKYIGSLVGDFHRTLLYSGIYGIELEKKRKERAQVVYERKKQLNKLRVKAEKVAEEKLGTQLDILAPVKY